MLWKFRSPFETPTPIMGVHLGVWRFIPSIFALPRACDVTPRSPSWLATLQPLALVTSPWLGLRHSCFYELQSFEKTHNFLQQTKITCDNYLTYFCPSASCPFHLFFRLHIVFKLTPHPWNYDGPSLSFFVSLVQPRGSMSPHHCEWMHQISSFDYSTSVALLGHMY
jgi:hypothetical protein